MEPVCLISLARSHANYAYRKIYGNFEDDEDLKAELRETTFAIAMQNCTGRRKRPVPAVPTSRAGPSKAKDGTQGGSKTGAEGDKTVADNSQASGSNANANELEYEN